MSNSDEIVKASQLLSLIDECSKFSGKCENTSSDCTEHGSDCFVTLDSHESPEKSNDVDSISCVPSCSMALLHLVLRVIATKPNLFEDDVKQSLITYFKGKKLSAERLISRQILELLESEAVPTSSRLTWLKYENLLIALIRQDVYQPESMANDVLSLVKDELDGNIASKLASVLESCVKHCREISKKRTDDKELEEKWCEIIDWMSWFLNGDEDMSDL